MPTKKKSVFRRLLLLLLLLFIVMNIVAALHGYNSTHYSDNPSTSKLKADGLTGLEKLKFLFTGASLPRPQNSKKPGIPYEAVYINSNVKLEAWYIKTKNAKGTVLLFHGYQSNKSNLIGPGKEFIKMGYNVLLVDFMGSGGSGGNTTTIGYKEGEEVKDCFEYIKNKGEKNIYLYGGSMGAASIMRAVAEYNIKPNAIAVACPFGTMYKTVCARFELMGAPKLPMAGLLTFWGGVENGFWAFEHNPEDYAKRIDCPTLLLWGEKDNRVSSGEINNIFDNLNGNKKLRTYPNLGHSGYLEHYHDEWVNDVQSFFKKY